MSLYGIVSWGAECGAKGYGGVYANIFQERDWILNTVQNVTVTLNENAKKNATDENIALCDISDLPSKLQDFF